MHIVLGKEVSGMEIRVIWNKLYPFLPAGVWYAVIFRLSAQTGSSSSATSGRIVYWLLEIPFLSLQSEEQRAAVLETLTFCVRKGAHMGAYFILTALLLLAVWRLISSPVRRAAVATGLCALLAGLDEFHQTFVPGRNGQVRDVFIDMAGSACFLLLWGTAYYFSFSRRGGEK